LGEGQTDELIWGMSNWVVVLGNGMNFVEVKVDPVMGE
jgi:hypothetical protein